MRLQLPQMPLKISLIAFNASSYPCGCWLSYRRPSFGVKFSHSVRLIQDYPQPQMPWRGGKKQECTTENYVIHNYLSQHSIMIMNALKMLTYNNLKKKIIRQ